MSTDVSVQRLFSPITGDVVSINVARFFVPITGDATSINVARLFVPIIVGVGATAIPKRAAQIIG